MKSVVQTLRFDLQDFILLSPQVRFLLFFQIIILFLLSILVGIIFSPKFKAQVHMRSGVALDTVPSVVPIQLNSLTIKPTSQTMEVGTTQKVEILYTGNRAEVIDTEISFDPRVIRVDGIKNGKIYDTVLQSKLTEGRLAFSAGLSLNELAKTTSTAGTVYTFSITALKKSDQTVLQFIQPNTFAWHDRKNVLTEFNNASITIELENRGNTEVTGGTN